MTSSFATSLARAAGIESHADLETAVATAWEAARAAHPSLAGGGDEFFAFVGVRVRRERGAPPRDELERRHVADLYLAWACSRGDAAALSALEHQILPAVERALASFADHHEVIQILRERMLVAKAGVCGIAVYDGRAPLTIWLRVCATRIALRHQQRERREVSVDDSALDQLAPGVTDPELAYLRRLYGASFHEAFREAVASLAVRERNLLRLSVVDGLGIDQLAAIFHIHRATVARQLKQARATLVATTRERMRITLAISESELESILRMIHSLTDLTLRHVLLPRAQESE